MRNSRGLLGRLPWRFLGPVALVSVALVVWAQTNTPPTLTGADPVSVRPDRSATVTLSATDVDTDPSDPTQSEPVMIQATAPTGAPAWLDDTGWSVSSQPNPQLSITVSPPSDAQPAQYNVTALATDSRGLSATGQISVGVLAPLCTAALEVDDGTGTCVACADHHVPNQSKTACLACAQDTERPAGTASCTACAAGTSSPGGSACAANQAPTAHAGADQSVETGAPVTLDGSGSSDPDGDALAYAWSQSGGAATVALSDAAAQSPTFTAPAAADTLTFTLTVTDGGGNSDTDTVTVTVAPPALSVTLSAQPASVCSGTPSTLSWTSAGADALTIAPSLSCAVAAGTDGTCAVSPTQETTWTATATAGTQTETAAATVSVTPPTQPSAPRNGARTGGTSSSVTIGWDAPSDLGACATSVEYRVFEYTSSACTSAVKVRHTDVGTATSHTAAGLTPGTGTRWFRVRARNDVASGWVSGPCFPAGADPAPTAHAGADQSVETGAPVTLDGSGSSDPDGDALAYAWSQSGGAATVALSDAAAQSPTFTAPAAADTLTFTLTVTDGGGNSDTDTVTVTVAPPALSVTLSAQPASVCSGTPSTLSWTSAGADALTIAPSLSCAVAAGTDGTCAVSPTQETTWTATATAGTQTETAAATVSVTPPTQPSAPRNGARTGGTSSSVTIGWDAPSDLGACATSVEYRVFEYTSSACTSAVKVRHTDVGTATSHTAAGLTPGTGTRWFRVRARNDVASGWVSGPCFPAGADPAPTAHAGADQSVETGAPVTLDGSGSSDPDGDALAYAWSQSGGAATVALSDAAAQSPTFTAPAAADTLTFTLTVTDGGGNSDTDTVTVTVAPPALSVTLSAQPASVCSGTPSTLSWTSAGADALTIAPSLSCAVAAGTDGTCAVSPTQETTWTATATAGTQTETAAATVSVTPPTQPSAPRNGARTGGTSSSVTIGWDAPSDLGACATSVEYRVFEYTSSACTSAVKVRHTDVGTATSHTAAGLTPGTGTRWFRVRARNDVASGWVSGPCFPAGADPAPTAHAGADQSVETGAPVTLDGSGSSDPDGDALAYAWSQSGGAATVALSDAAAQSPTFTAPAAADTLTFTLTVTDGGGNSDTDTVTVTVAPPALSVTLSAQPASVCSGTPSTLSWTSAGADALTIAPSLSCAVAAGTDGTCAVSPTQETTWTATATAGTQTETAAATVSVTPPTQPSAPRNGARTGGTSSSVTIGWDAPSDLGACATSVEYRVFEYTSSACTSAVKVRHTDVGTATSHTAAGLTPGTGTRWFRVRARNDVASGWVSGPCFPAGADPAPTAHAGADQSVETGAPVTLDGSGSSDPDGDALAYAWSQSGGAATVALSDAAAQSPTFTAPAAADTLTFTLTVTDGGGNSDTDTVTVTVAPPALSVTLSAQPASVCSGTPSTLSWTSAGADALTIAPSLSCAVAAGTDGTCAVSPTQETTWTATATAGTQTETAAATVSVTPPTQPSAPRNGARTGGTSSSVTIGWDAPSDLGACATSVEYRVFEYTSSACTSAVKVRHTDVGTATSHTAAGLTPGTGTRWFRVRARNDVASGWVSGPCFPAGADPAPTAHAGADQSVETGAPVTLDGSGSSDPDGDALAYAWSQSGGAATVALSDAAAQSPTFTAPAAADTLTFTLTVTDGGGNSDTDTVTVTVAPPALSVTLSAQPASVCSGTPSTLSWTSAGADALTIAPSLSCAVAAGTDGTCAVSPTQETTWTATATAGTQTETAAATVSVTPPTQPSAPRNGARTGGTSSSVTIGWDAPSDLGACATSVEYRVFEYTSSACTSAVKVRHTDVGTATSHTAAGLTPGTGTRWFRVRARNDVASGWVSGPCFPAGADPAPTAHAGADQSVETGAPVTLDGSGSSDPDGDALAYAWSQSGGAATVALSDAAAQSPTFTAPAAADTLTFTLTVTDGGGNSDTDTVTVTVAPPALSVTLSAQPASVCSGTPSTLSWTSAGADALTIAPSLSCAVAAGTDGTCAVSPTQETTWTATATAGTQTETAAATVSVTPPTQPSAPRNGARTGGTSSSVTIGWDAPSDLGACATSVEYRVFEYTSSACTSAVKVRHTDVGTATSHTAAGLTPGTGTRWFRVRARNDVASGWVSGPCFPAGASPDFGTLTIPDQRLAKDVPIAPATLPAATGGNGTLTYSLTPALPAGLAFDAATRVVSGTPTASQAPTLHTYTATDEDGSAASLTFSVAVGRQLTVSPPSNGTVTGTVGAETVIDCGTDCTAIVADGATVSLTASPDSGYYFSAWGGACAGTTAATCSITLDANRSLSATFTEVRGICDETVVDGCSAGTLNTTAHQDTGTDHHWRCDGIGGGANSPKCTKAKNACTGHSQSWTVGANSCSGPLPDTNSGATETATDSVGTVTGTARFTCDDGNWTEQQPGGSTCGRECAGSSKSWSYGGDDCSATLAKAKHLQTKTATDSTYRDTGSATYACNDSAWTGPSSETCFDGCPAQTLSNCVLSDTVHDGTSGTCASGYDGTCSYSCTDGVWSEASNSCALPPPPSPCGEASRNWTDGGDSCSASLPAAPHGGTSTATDNSWRDTGSATYSCDDSVWTGPSSKSCYDGCDGTTKDNCELLNTIHDGTSGTCASGYEGFCAYSCDDGVWSETTNNCALTVCAESYKYWTFGGDTCSATVPAGLHGDTITVIDNDWRETGSATYTCNVGFWTGPTSESCYDGCVNTTKDYCGLIQSVHGGTSGFCASGYDGSCEYSCNDGNWYEDSNTCTKLLTLTVTVTTARGTSGARVTGHGIDCPGTCSVDLPYGTPVSLSASTDPGYGCGPIPGITLTSDTTVPVSCDSTLDAEPGGPYTANFYCAPSPIGVCLATASVAATASGGVAPYTYQWEGTLAGATAIYVFVTPGPHQKSVSVTDSASVADSDTAVINTVPSGSQAGAYSASSDPDPFEVPLGGDLFFVWGEDGPVTASSGDDTIVAVAVNAPAIRVMGVGLGDTEVILNTDSGELRLPVVVR